MALTGRVTAGQVIRAARAESQQTGRDITTGRTSSGRSGTRRLTPSEMAANAKQAEITRLQTPVFYDPVTGKTYSNLPAGRVGYKMTLQQAEIERTKQTEALKQIAHLKDKFKNKPQTLQGITNYENRIKTQGYFVARQGREGDIITITKKSSLQARAEPFSESFRKQVRGDKGAVLRGTKFEQQSILLAQTAIDQRAKQRKEFLGLRGAAQDIKVSTRKAGAAFETARKGTTTQKIQALKKLGLVATSYPKKLIQGMANLAKGGAITAREFSQLIDTGMSIKQNQALISKQAKKVKQGKSLSSKDIKRLNNSGNKLTKDLPKLKLGTKNLKIAQDYINSEETKAVRDLSILVVAGYGLSPILGKLASFKAGRVLLKGATVLGTTQLVKVYAAEARKKGIIATGVKAVIELGALGIGLKAGSRAVGKGTRSNINKFRSDGLKQINNLPVHQRGVMKSSFKKGIKQVAKNLLRPPVKQLTSVQARSRLKLLKQAQSKGIKLPKLAKVSRKDILKELSKLGYNVVKGKIQQKVLVSKLKFKSKISKQINKLLSKSKSSLVKLKALKPTLKKSAWNKLAKIESKIRNLTSKLKTLKSKAKYRVSDQRKVDLINKEIKKYQKQIGSTPKQLKKAIQFKKARYSFKDIKGNTRNFNKKKEYIKALKAEAAKPNFAESQARLLNKIKTTKIEKGRIALRKEQKELAKIFQKAKRTDYVTIKGKKVWQILDKTKPLGVRRFTSRKKYLAVLRKVVGKTPTNPKLLRSLKSQSEISSIRKQYLSYLKRYGIEIINKPISSKVMGKSNKLISPETKQVKRILDTAKKFKPVSAKGSSKQQLQLLQKIKTKVKPTIKPVIKRIDNKIKINKNQLKQILVDSPIKNINLINILRESITLLSIYKSLLRQADKRLSSSVLKTSSSSKSAQGISFVQKGVQATESSSATKSISKTIIKSALATTAVVAGVTVAGLVSNQFIPFPGSPITKGGTAAPSTTGVRSGVRSFQPFVQQKFMYLSDLASKFYGVKATKEEARSLLTPGRVFTSLGQRKVITKKIRQELAKERRGF